MQNIIGSIAPNFVSKVVMPDNSIVENFEFHKNAENKINVLFFYPLDFTFVCPSELLAINNKIHLFQERNAAIYGISVDSHFSHLAWKNTPVTNGGIGNVQFPLISDITKEISRNYGVLFDNSVALRGVFIMDEELIVRHQMINDLPLGRNINEILRIIDAIKYHKKHGEVCPANWKDGDPAMKPNSEGVASYLSNHSDMLN